MAHGINLPLLGIIMLANITEKEHTFIISIYSCKFFILPFLGTKGLGCWGPMLQKGERSPLTQHKCATSLWACSLKEMATNFNLAI